MEAEAEPPVAALPWPDYVPARLRLGPLRHPLRRDAALVNALRSILVQSSSSGGGGAVGGGGGGSGGGAGVGRVRVVVPLKDPTAAPAVCAASAGAGAAAVDAEAQPGQPQQNYSQPLQLQQRLGAFDDYGVLEFASTDTRGIDALLHVLLPVRLRDVVAGVVLDVLVIVPAPVVVFAIVVVVAAAAAAATKAAVVVVVAVTIGGGGGGGHCKNALVRRLAAPRAQAALSLFVTTFLQTALLPALLLLLLSFFADWLLLPNGKTNTANRLSTGQAAWCCMCTASS